MVELALVLPALLALALGTACLARMYRAQTSVDTAAAEAARHVAQEPGVTASELADYANSAVGAEGIEVSASAGDALGAGSTPSMLPGGITASRSTRTVTPRGATSASEVSVSDWSVEVTCSMDVDLMGLGSWTATSSHSSVWSEAGL